MNDFGWDLPPGVTNKMIDNAATYVCKWCGNNETEHWRYDEECKAEYIEEQIYIKLRKEEDKWDL